MPILLICKFYFDLYIDSKYRYIAGIPKAKCRKCQFEFSKTSTIRVYDCYEIYPTHLFCETCDYEIYHHYNNKCPSCFILKNLKPMLDHMKDN